jgi:hypothetical protein
LIPEPLQVALVRHRRADGGGKPRVQPDGLHVDQGAAASLPSLPSSRQPVTRGTEPGHGLGQSPGQAAPSPSSPLPGIARSPPRWSRCRTTARPTTRRRMAATRRPPRLRWAAGTRGHPLPAGRLPRRLGRARHRGGQGMLPGWQPGGVPHQAGQGLPKWFVAIFVVQNLCC